jgi:hypothetical protein
MWGEWFTKATIYIALVCLAIRIYCVLTNRVGSERFARQVNTWGCLFFCLHVLCAFAFFHNWSHASAFEVTAKRTDEMLGIRFGEGIYFSYVFLILWILESLWHWLSVLSYAQRPRFITWSIWLYLAFIAFNGAVIFEAGITRWLGVPVSLYLVFVALSNWQYLKQTEQDV